MMCILALLTKKSFLPTPKDVENDELKNLAERLKGDSEKETLTNILEWQDRNIPPWWERWPLGPLLLVLPLISLALLVLMITLPFLLPFSHIFKLLIAGILVSSVIFMVYLFIRYRMLFGEESVKEKTKFREVVIDTFRPSLPVDKILKYRLAVCRDYAKLTASLLFRVYRDSELYFITIPRHVAVGIKIKNKIYVLDQRLPILTKDDWLNKEEACTYISKLKRDPNGRLEVTFKRHKTITLEEKKVPINTEKLTEEIAEIFGIEPTSHINKPDFEIHLSNYEDDEITKYSLIRKIKNRLEREFCGSMDKMSKISINQDKISVKIKET